MGTRLEEVIRLAEELLRKLSELAKADPAALPATPAPDHGKPESMAWAGHLRRIMAKNDPANGAARAEVFLDRVKWIAETLDIGPKPGEHKPGWVMTWMAFETGRTFSPAIKNPNSSGTGLIQFMDATARDDLKTTLAEIRSLNAEDQLRYVYKYLNNRIKERGPIRRISDGYLAILMPAYMDDPDETVVWLKNKHKAFAVNAGLDVNKDGQITKAEIAGVIYKMYAEGMQPENAG